MLNTASGVSVLLEEKMRIYSRKAPVFQRAGPAVLKKKGCAKNQLVQLATIITVVDFKQTGSFYPNKLDSGRLIV